jgi:tryptophan-rich sensory protein
MTNGVNPSGVLSLPMRDAWAWALAACATAVVLEAISSGTGVRLRFAELRLPRFAPPLWAWSILGSAYYILFFFLLKSLLDRPAIPLWTQAGLALAAVLLLANASWNWVFFRKKDLWLSFVLFAPYLLVAFALAAVLFRIRNPLLDWYLVYLGYLAYAAWWGYSVWRLNARQQKMG